MMLSPQALAIITQLKGTEAYRNLIKPLSQEYINSLRSTEKEKNQLTKFREALVLLAAEINDAAATLAAQQPQTQPDNHLTRLAARYGALERAMAEDKTLVKEITAAATVALRSDNHTLMRTLKPGVTPQEIEEKLLEFIKANRLDPNLFKIERDATQIRIFMPLEHRDAFLKLISSMVSLNSSPAVERARAVTPDAPEPRPTSQKREETDEQKRSRPSDTPRFTPPIGRK